MLLQAQVGNAALLRRFCRWGDRNAAGFWFGKGVEGVKLSGLHPDRFDRSIGCLRSVYSGGFSVKTLSLIFGKPVRRRISAVPGV